MIYIKRITNADITRQIDLTKETASSFFAFDPDVVSQRSLVFLDESTNVSYSGSIKKSGHSTTITGDIFSFVKHNCDFGDIVVFSTTRSNSQFKFHVIKRTDSEFSGYDHALNLFGSRSGVINETTHLIASIDDEVVEKIHKELDSDSDLIPYLTAIRTKPFLLLAGISGTGKSRIVRKLAQATNDIDFAADYDGDDRWKMHSPTNFCLIQVKPNWHNSMDVVGFKSNIGGAHYEFTPFIEFIAKAWHYPDTPFFLCLDEMNLAPVEEYFAEFLSAIESRSYNQDGEYETDPIIKPFREFGEEVAIEMVQHLLGEKMENIDDDRQLSHVGWRFLNKGLSLPKNLIVMGTVNMDETTFSFSRKVLDRAMSIEMNEVDYDAFLTGATEEDVPLLTGCNKLMVDRPINAQLVKNDIEADKIIGYLKSVNALLEGTPFKLGYRAANEAFLYVSAAKMFGSDDLGSALDKFTVMKILSRIEGDDSKLKTKSGDDLLPALLDLLTNQFSEEGKSISVQKLTEMNDILTRDHFVSFWG